MSTRKNPRPRALAILAAAGLAALAATAPAAAQSIVSEGQSFVFARLLPGGPDGGGGRLAGLRLGIAPGWKTYWRSPGEAGVPPTFDWSGSDNLARAEVLWPRPKVFESFGMQTIGYGGTVVLPLLLVPSDPARPVSVRLRLELGVCRDICVFEQALLEAVLPADATGGETEIAAAMATLPAVGAQSGLTSATCRVSGAGADRRLEADLLFDRPLNEPVVAVEGADGVWVHSIDSKAEGGHLNIVAGLALADPEAWVERGTLRFTVLDGNWAADVQGCTAPAG